MTTSREKVTLHVVRKSDLRQGAGSLRQWDDPHKLAGFTPEKRNAVLTNPLGRSDDEPVQILGLQGNTVIGKIDLLAGELLVNNQPLPTFWTSAYYVPEDYRHTMVGIMIVLKMQQLHHTIAACGVSQMALPIFQKLKWLDFMQPRYMLLRRSRAVVEKYLGGGLRATIATGAADTGLLLHRVALRGLISMKSAGLRVEQSTTANVGATLVSPSSFPVQPHRSDAWLNWLLSNTFSPDPTLRKGLFLIRGRSSAVVGYFLLKMRRFETASHRGFKNVLMGSLYDWSSFDPSCLNDTQIALLATRQLFRWNADAIEICTDNATVGTSLRRLGFLRLSGLHTLVRSVNPSPLAHGFPNQSDWGLRPADGDNFFM